MRIAVIASLLDSKPTGLGVYTRHVVEKLAHVIGKEHALTVYTSYPDAFRHHSTLAGAVVSMPRMLQPKYGPGAALARFAWSQAMLPPRLAQYDLLYCPTHHGLLGSEVPQVVTVHDLLPIKFPKQYRLQHYYFRTVVPKLIARAAAVIADSESTKQDLHQYYGLPLAKIHVVYSGIESHLRPIPEEERAKVLLRYELTQYVLMVGASFPHKNIESAIEAWALLISKWSQVELVIAGGRAGYIESLKQKVNACGAKRIRFLGYVPNEDLPPLYSGAMALLYPSLYEGFGLPPLEAMACGCPVIVSNVSSLPEVCGDAASYVDPNSARSIAEAVEQVITDHTLNTTLRHKGLERARFYSWEQTAMDVLSVLESVLRLQRAH